MDGNVENVVEAVEYGQGVRTNVLSINSFAVDSLAYTDNNTFVVGTMVWKYLWKSYLLEDFVTSANFISVNELTGEHSECNGLCII